MIFPIILILGSLFLLLNDMGILKWYQMKKERNNIQIAINQLILEEKSLMEELDRLENDEEYLKNTTGILFLGQTWFINNNKKPPTVKQIREGILDEVPYWTP